MSIPLICICVAFVFFVLFCLTFEDFELIPWVCLATCIGFFIAGFVYNERLHDARAEQCSQEGGSYIRGKCLDIKTIKLK